MQVGNLAAGLAGDIEANWYLPDLRQDQDCR